MIDPVVHIVFRAGLALLFAFAAFHKGSNRERFAATLEQYRLLPKRAVPVCVDLLIIVEASLAVALLLPLIYRAAALAIGFVLGTYSAAIGVNLVRGRAEIDCGCLGPTERTSLGWWLIARNGALFVVAAGVLLPQTTRPFHWLDAVTVPAAVLTVMFLWAAAHRLLQNRPLQRRHA